MMVTMITFSGFSADFYCSIMKTQLGILNTHQLHEGLVSVKDTLKSVCSLLLFLNETSEINLHCGPQVPTGADEWLSTSIIRLLLLSSIPSLALNPASHIYLRSLYEKRGCIPEWKGNFSKRKFPEAGALRGVGTMRS